MLVVFEPSWSTRNVADRYQYCAKVEISSPRERRTKIFYQGYFTSRKNSGRQTKNDFAGSYTILEITPPWV